MHGTNSASMVRTVQGGIVEGTNCPDNIYIIPRGIGLYRIASVHGLRRRSRRIGCQYYHRCASWWVYSPNLEWQILEQLSHGQAPRLLVGSASPLQTARLCWRTATLASSNCLTASWHCDLQFERSCESMLRVDGCISNFFMFSLRESL